MRSLRARLTIAIVLTAVLSLVAAALLTFDLIRRYNAQYALGQLDTVARTVAAEAGDDLILQPFRLRQLQRILQASGHQLATIDSEGKLLTPLGKKAEALYEAIDVRPVLAGSSVTGFVDIDDFRFAYVAIPTRVARRAARPLAGVVLGRDAGLSWNPILSRVLLGAGAAALVAAIAAAVWAERLARPVNRVASATARVASGDLSIRVPVHGSDELADLATSFNAMATALGEARRREAEFLANVSHELRTPLTAIRGYVEALDEGAVHGEKGRAEALGVIKNETARLDRLVADVTDLARLGTQEFRLSLRDSDLAPVLHDAASAHPGTTPRVELVVKGSLPCHTDPDRVRQVIANLVENALRVTPDDGTVSISGKAQGSWIIIDVADTGPGIPAEHLPHVFERAYLRNLSAAEAAPSGAGRLVAGSGLGLAIVRELVRALGGRVDVASEVGRGTTFRVALPAR